jgi:hypothetical protein
MTVRAELLLKTPRLRWNAFEPELAQLGKINRFPEVVPQPPMPVVFRHVEDGLLLAVGKYQSVLKRVHVRMQAHEHLIVCREDIT